MSHTLLIVPTGLGVGLTSITLGLVRAVDSLGLQPGFHKPFAQRHHSDQGPERSSQFAALTSHIQPPTPIDPKRLNEALSEDRLDELLEAVVAQHEQCAQDADVVIVEGLVPSRSQTYAQRLNLRLAQALDADVILVAAPGNTEASALDEQIEMTANSYGGLGHSKVLGLILNKLYAPVDDEGRTRPDLFTQPQNVPTDPHPYLQTSQLLTKNKIPLLGQVPWSQSLIAPRMKDVADFLDAEILHQGDLEQRRLKRLTLVARNVENMLEDLQPETLVITSGDRSDVIIAAAMAAANGVPLAGILLTGGYRPTPAVLKLCQAACERGLPILAVSAHSLGVALKLPRFNFEVPLDDISRMQHVMDHVANHFDMPLLGQLLQQSRQRRLSPPAFRYQLVARAQAAAKRIVLPEGEEPRTIQAAAICAERGIAHCILLGDPEVIQRTAEQHGVTLGTGVTVADPVPLREAYVETMVQLRKHKGVTEVVAREHLEDTVVLGTLMLYHDEVDGLVSGAVHTTANTIRPALQYIKTAEHARIVSSIFFMCLPEQVLVYGDCAVNPDPNAEELADIAIQSADSAAAFGIQPRVAMISYSTGQSGSGADVDKVRQATTLAQQKRPDLIIDGPLQYDAALIANVAKKKAPNSPVAGQATVVIFPDLNTGNTTYKAVQRSADVISIGPMLQGLRKPVNDLSRGALIEDIVFTIALTAIQATQDEK